MKKNVIKCVLISCVILVLWGGNPRAEIYSYVDEDGVKHFTDSPTKTEMVLFIDNGSVVSRDKTYYSPDQFNDIIMKASSEHGVSYSLIKALIKVESDFNPYAISRMGAKGLMQIMPKNMDELSISDPFDPYENIMGGTFYLRQMLNRFDGELVLALAAYNAGPTVVEKYNNIPPYSETRDFVEKVIKYTYHYR